MEVIIADNLRYLRVENNMTAEDLADELGVNRSTVYRWESGDWTPNEERIEQISDYFGITPEELELGVM